MQNINVVLVRSRFPENIGMAARACANMGLGNLSLVLPERWSQSEKSKDKAEPDNYSAYSLQPPSATPTLTYKEKAAALATVQGAEILEKARIFNSLKEAVGQSTMVFGTTARLGGWRQNILTPEKAAFAARECIAEGGEVSFVFGSEDTGLLNSEVEQCDRLICIPTAPEAASLNLAQAVLIILYEVQKQFLDPTPNAPVSLRAHTRQGGRLKTSPSITAEQKELLLHKISETLAAINYLPEQNPAYFMLPLRNFISNSALKNNEYSMLMGICRKIMFLTQK